MTGKPRRERYCYCHWREIRVQFRPRQRCEPHLPEDRRDYLLNRDRSQCGNVVTALSHGSPIELLDEPPKPMKSGVNKLRFPVVPPPKLAFGMFLDLASSPNSCNDNCGLIESQHLLKPVHDLAMPRYEFRTAMNMRA